MDYYPRYSRRPAASKSASSYYGREVDHHEPPSNFHDYRADYDDYWRDNRDNRCDYDDYNRNYRDYRQDYDGDADYNRRNYRSQSPNHSLRRHGYFHDSSSLAPKSSSRGSDRINRRYKPYQSPPLRIRRPNPSREYERPPPQQWRIDRNKERPWRHNQNPLNYNRDGGEYQSREAESRRKYNRPPPRYDDHQRREAQHPRYNNRPPPRYDDHQRREAHHPRYNNRPRRYDGGKHNHRSAAANHRSSQPLLPPPPPPLPENVFVNTDYSDHSPSPGSPALSSPSYSADAPRSCSPVMELSPDNAALSEFFNASFDAASQSSCDDGGALWM